MPNYTLKCQSCGHEQEQLCRYNAIIDVECEECDKKAMRVKITQGMGTFLASSLRIKGRHSKWIKERGL